MAFDLLSQVHLGYLIDGHLEVYETLWVLLNKNLKIEFKFVKELNLMVNLIL